MQRSPSRCFPVVIERLTRVRAFPTHRPHRCCSFVQSRPSTSTTITKSRTIPKSSCDAAFIGGAVIVLLTGSALVDGSNNKAGMECNCGMSSWRREELNKFLRKLSSPNDHDLDQLPEYTSEQVSQHNSENSRIWMSYGGYVMDVTSFIALHPGGAERISRAAGDAIEPFWYLHQQHFTTKEPLKIMRGLIIGRLREADQEKVDAKLEAMQQEWERFQLQVDWCGKIAKWSLQDLKSLPKTDLTSQVGCRQSQQGGVSTSLFGGVRLQELLPEENQKLEKIVFYALDGERVEVDVSDGNSNYQDILLCYEMDGAPLTKRRGFPLRIIIPERRAVKWVNKIRAHAIPTKKKSQLTSWVGKLLLYVKLI